MLLSLQPILRVPLKQTVEDAVLDSNAVVAKAALISLSLACKGPPFLCYHKERKEKNAFYRFFFLRSEVEQEFRKSSNAT